VAYPCAPVPKLVVLQNIVGGYGIRRLSVFVVGDHQDHHAEMRMCCPLTSCSRDLGDPQALERPGALNTGSQDLYTCGVRLGGLSSGM